MAVVDPTEVVAAQALTRELLGARVPDLNPAFEDAHAHPLADQPRGNGVSTLLDPHGAPLADAEVLLDELRELRDVERAHPRHILGEATAARPVGLAHGVVDERLPRAGALGGPAATHQERLLEGTFEGAVGRLDVGVLLLRTATSVVR